MLWTKNNEGSNDIFQVYLNWLAPLGGRFYKNWLKLIKKVMILYWYVKKLFFLKKKNESKSGLNVHPKIPFEKLVNF